MESGRRDVGGLERIESEQVVNAQETRNALEKQFIRLAKLGDPTPSVMNVERLEFRNTTPLTVTAFDDGQNGQRIEVLGDGNTTIEHNAKIMCASGADTLLDAGSTYAFTRYTDGVWHQSAGGSGGGGGGGGGAGVATFAGRSGAVVPVNTDYTPAFIGAVPTSHLSDPDPHTQYALDSQKGVANGYASLDSGGLVPAAQLPAAGAGRTLIQSQILVAAATFVTFTGIPATYSDLLLQIFCRGTTGGSNTELRLRMNNDSGNNYTYSHENRFSTTQSDTSSYIQMGSIEGAGNLASVASVLEIRLDRYRSGTWFRVAQCNSWTRISGGGVVANAGGVWQNATAVNRLDVFLAAGDFAIGSEFHLYGI